MKQAKTLLTSSFLIISTHIFFIFSTSKMHMKIIEVAVLKRIKNQIKIRNFINDSFHYLYPESSVMDLHQIIFACNAIKVEKSSDTSERDFL